MPTGVETLLEYDNDSRPAWMRARDRALFYRAKAVAPAHRRRLRNRDFTIISNDCWAAEVYQHLDLPYNTPFVGGFLFAPCYIRLLKDLRGYLEGPVEFTHSSRYDSVNLERARGEAPDYPIAVLGGEVEIHYNHYTDDEARDRYRRRAQRVNYDNLIVKTCTGKDLWTTERLEEFDALDYSRKLCLTDRDYPQLKSAVKLRRYTTNAALQFYTGLSEFDLVEWLNDDGV